MKKCKIFASLLALSTHVFAVNVNHSLDIRTGYRNDKITTSIVAFDPPGTFILADDLNASHINVFEIGASGRLKVGSNWLLRGYAYYGMVCNGSYSEITHTPNNSSSITTADIYQGDTNDYSAGIGYLFNCFGLSLGPIAGWSFDSQRIKMQHAVSNGLSNPILNNLVYKTRFEGPWLGVETQFSICKIKIAAGYEYHWSDWRGNWQLAGPDIFGGSFSDIRKSNDAIGNLIFIDGSYIFCNGFSAGLSIKYQEWKVKNGNEVPTAGSFPAVGLGANEVDVIPDASWKSYSLLASLGYHF